MCTVATLYQTIDSHPNFNVFGPLMVATPTPLVLHKYLQFLDMCDLSVSSVMSTDTSESLSFEEQTPEGAFGSVLAITLPATCANQ